jgi:hypothetical protein
MQALRHPLGLTLAAMLVLQVGATPPSGNGKSVIQKMETPMAETQFGRITLGAKFSEDLQSGFGDIIAGGYVAPNTALFVNVRGTFDDNDQQIFSAGLGVRHLFEDPGVIIGANVYYDYLDTAYGNSINQLGFGAEVLTKWVDARFNYYLPEDDSFLVRGFDVTRRNRSVGPEFADGNLFKRNLSTSTTVSSFGIYEKGLEGWNAEAGFLVPGLDRYVDLRLFAGLYNYQDPKGGSIGGFRARAEARITEGITLDLEYWEDEELVGGNWVGGVRVSVPFDIGNLFTGRNPFEGAGDMLKRPAHHDMRDRMDEMVIRSHRIQSGLTGPQLTGTHTSTDVKTVTTGVKVMPPVTLPPPTGGGSESPESPEIPPEQVGEF